MGFNTVVVVLNDQLHEIQKDEKFGEELFYHIQQVSSRRGVSYGPHGTKALPSEHADTMQIVAVGGNTARVLGYSRWNADDLQCLRDLADRMGYTLRKKPSVRTVAMEV